MSGTGNFRTNLYFVIVTRDVDLGTVLDSWMFPLTTTLSFLGVTQLLKANHSAYLNDNYSNVAWSYEMFSHKDRE